MAFDHSQLATIAAEYARTVLDCGPCVATEVRRGPYGERPDVFGVSRLGLSVLIEAKTSRSDFEADRKKDWRLPGQGVGDLRYYIAEPGIIPRDQIPNRWGLLLVAPDGSVIEDIEAQTITPAYRAERAILARMIHASAGPGSVANPPATELQGWLDQVQAYVLEHGPLYASEAVRGVGLHHFFKSVTKAADTVASSVGQGRLPSLRLSIVGARPYLSPRVNGD